MVSSSTLALIGLAVMVVLVLVPFVTGHVLYRAAQRREWQKNKWSKR